MYIPEDEKDGRKAALKKLIDVMGKGAGAKMGELKKPVAVGIEVDKEPDEDDPLMDKPMMDKGMEPSEEEKSMIAELYRKYC